MLMSFIMWHSDFVVAFCCKGVKTKEKEMHCNETLMIIIILS